MSPRPRLATAADLPRVDHALARAFLDDPMITWLIDRPDPQERLAAAIDGFFTTAVRGSLRRGHSYLVDDDTDTGAPAVASAALWSPPDVPSFTDDEAAALAGALVAACGEPALERLIALGELVGPRHPEEPHFYLFLLGAVTPGRRSGSVVLQPVLERCDLDGLPAYLESSSARNLSFYERHGFRVVWEAAPDGGPTMRGMWREPGGPHG